METLPLELLGAIALELPIPELRRFRLLGRRYAAAGFPALVRELSFLNTLDTADALRTLSQSPYGSLGAVRHLAIYDGAWPVAASQEEWARHSLFLRSRKRSNSIATRLAYNRYEQFIRQEASRTCSRLQRLNVDGLLDTRDLEPGRYRYKTIRHLYVNAVLAGEGLEDSIANFLGAFPRLTTLTIKTFPRGSINHQRLPLQQMRWSDLQFCDIVGTWAPENELFDFMERHPLKRLTLKQVTLTSGSWKSYFSRARDLKPRPNIVCEGILPNRDSEGYFIEDFKSQRLLDWFLTHAEFPWPFSDPNDDIPTLSLSS
ncbi:hypothetical protein VTG60DRAFT_7352 [Thermothelomyces hinnuleus]